MTIREVKLPSGAVLKLQPSPFKEAKVLYQAVLHELRGITVSTKAELPTIWKDLFAVGFSSPLIDSALDACMKRCTYVSTKGVELKCSDPDTWEPAEAREDYLTACMEVLKENVFPFGKALFAMWQERSGTTPSDLASKGQG